MFNVPLLLRNGQAVIYRLDPAGTDAATPYVGATSGYDPDFRNPLVFDDVGGDRATARVELAPVRVLCQVETPRFEEQHQGGSGWDPSTVLVLVVHRMDLEDAGLYDDVNGLGIKIDDRVTGIEKYNEPGVLLQAFEEDLFVIQARPGSWGFYEGTALFLIELAPRQKVP